MAELNEGVVFEHLIRENRLRTVTIGFWDHFKVGAPLTILTIAIGAWLL
jgi:hypothetical protein